MKKGVIFIIFIIVNIFIGLIFVSSDRIESDGDITSYIYMPGYNADNNIYAIRDINGSDDNLKIDIDGIFYYFNETKGTTVPVLITHPTIKINNELFRKGDAYGNFVTVAIPIRSTSGKLTDARLSKVIFPIELYSDKGNLFIGNLDLNFNQNDINKNDPNSMGTFILYGVIINNSEQEKLKNENRFLSLENWKNTLSPQVQTLLNGNILSRLNTIEYQKINSIENNLTLIKNRITSSEVNISSIIQRLITLENKTSQNQSQLNSPYFKYLGASDRKNIICGYAEDNHLISYEDLGWHCDMTYSVSRTGRESIKCKCYKV